MRYPTEHKTESRLKLIDAASRGFKKRGFGGIGVDGLAKEAQVTSGAFYGHFGSKDDAFREALRAGLSELTATVERLQADCGNQWLETFVDFYTGSRRTCDLSESCALQSMTADVIRAAPDTRAMFEAELRKLTAAVADGLPKGLPAEKEGRALALLSILSGGVTMARAVNDPALSASIGQAVRMAALQAANAP